MSFFSTDYHDALEGKKKKKVKVFGKHEERPSSRVVEDEPEEVKDVPVAYMHSLFESGKHPKGLKKESQLKYIENAVAQIERTQTLRHGCSGGKTPMFQAFHKNFVTQRILGG